MKLVLSHVENIKINGELSLKEESGKEIAKNCHHIIIGGKEYICTYVRIVILIRKYITYR